MFPPQMLVILPYNRCSPSVSLPCSPGAGHAVECAGREPEGPGGGWALLQGGSWEALHRPEGDWPWELRSSVLRKLPSLVFGSVKVKGYCCRSGHSLHDRDLKCNFLVNIISFKMLFTVISDRWPNDRDTQDLKSVMNCKCRIIFKFN